MIDHLLVNTAATLSILFSAGDADGDVTVDITDAAGRAVGTTGTATRDVTVAGRYTYDLEPQTECASLTVSWAGAWGGQAETVESYVEVVGAVLFPVSTLRSFGDGALTSDTKYPDSALIEARGYVTDWFERICNVSFIPRYQRDTLDGLRRHHLWLSRHRVNRILSVTEDGAALTAGDLADLVVYPNGKLWRDTHWSTASRQNITVEYVAGWTQPPAAIQQAALVMARYQLVNADFSDRALSFQNDLGTVRISTPGERYPTGLPVVDAALARYDESTPLEAAFMA